MRNLSNENEFDLHENELRGGTHFHMNAFAQRLVFIQRQKVTRKCLLRMQLSHCNEISTLTVNCVRIISHIMYVTNQIPGLGTSFGDINQTELCMILCLFHSVKAFCI